MTDIAVRTDPIHTLRPTGKYVCGACWAVSDAECFPLGWVFFRFKYLDSAWLCPGCQPQWAPHHSQLQARGL